ncbi:MAG: hypothetical protein LBW85_10055 [Deltaproteobacteria bacterium]|jgi:hypothetical protein|nr:hypothetical protein [Deltaproteobacteria bacterium]
MSASGGKKGGPGVGQDDLIRLLGKGFTVLGKVADAAGKLAEERRKTEEAVTEGKRIEAEVEKTVKLSEHETIRELAACRVRLDEIRSENMKFEIKANAALELAEREYLKKDGERQERHRQQMEVMGVIKDIIRFACSEYSKHMDFLRENGGTDFPSGGSGPLDTLNKAIAQLTDMLNGPKGNFPSKR